MKLYFRKVAPSVMHELDIISQTGQAHSGGDILILTAVHDGKQKINLRIDGEYEKHQEKIQKILKSEEFRELAFFLPLEFLDKITEKEIIEANIEADSIRVGYEPDFDVFWSDLDGEE